MNSTTFTKALEIMYVEEVTFFKFFFHLFNLEFYVEGKCTDDVSHICFKCKFVCCSFDVRNWFTSINAYGSSRFVPFLLQILFYKIISVCQHVKVLVFPFPLIGTFGLNFDYML